MQCKDIPAYPILAFLKGRLLADWTREASPDARSVWATHFQPFDNSIPFPAEVPENLHLAKMKVLLRNGLVSGCGCGCRGDWTITNKGLDYLESNAN